MQSPTVGQTVTAKGRPVDDATEIQAHPLQNPFIKYRLDDITYMRLIMDTHQLYFMHNLYQ